MRLPRLSPPRNPLPQRPFFAIVVPLLITAVGRAGPLESMTMSSYIPPLHHDHLYRDPCARRGRRGARAFSFVGMFIVAVAALACGDDGSDSNTSASSSSVSTSTSGSGGASGSGGNTAAGGMGGGGTGSGGDGSGGSAAGNYPAGPYGTTVGDTVAFLEFKGYVSPHPNATPANLGPYVDFSMLDIKNAGSPFVILHLAAMF
ncbi:MAG TPA: hypothetical protein ENK23_01825 [Sorangium sp.]|nr:hypothetical protein [Sorangium sp.]